MTDQRKASEVLLELEAKVDKLMEIVQLYDMNIKLILGKVNQTFTTVTQLVNQSGLGQAQRSEIQQHLALLQNPEMVEIPKGIPVKLATEFPGQRRLDPRGQTQPDTEVASQVAKPASPEPSQSINPPPSNRKVSVSQRVQDQSKRDLFMAEVVILSPKKEVVAKSKSNAMGKWSAQLSPGKYLISVVKTDPTSKQKFGQTQEITVGETETTLTLPTLFLDRAKHVL